MLCYTTRNKFIFIGGVILATGIAKVIQLIVVRNEPETDEKTEKEQEQIKSWKRDVCLIIYLYIGQAVCGLVWDAIRTSAGIRVSNV